MKDISTMYKIAILLAIGAGFISVLQTDQLRSQLKHERGYLRYYENHFSLTQKEILNEYFENGYKKGLIDNYHGKPKYLIIEDPNDKKITMWKKEKGVNTTP